VSGAPAPQRPYAGARVLLGVSGGIASYKTAWLARLLTLAGAEVDVVMTPAALEFVGAITFEALTGRPVHSEIFGAGNALDHVKLARAANAIVVAPATADFCARAASGQANDVLTAILLAASAPVMLVPAMNDHMWAHPQTQRNIAHLRSIGYQVVPPDEGMLAAGEGSGPGRMPEPETIFAHVGWLLEERRALGGKRIVVTSGPTREPVDPVRFLSNHSSGKMGNAIAAAAWRRGAEVVLITGPGSAPTPPGACVVRVETTEQMRDAVARELPGADALIMAAAPADFRPSEIAAEKIKKSSSPAALKLSPTPDILASTIDARPAGSIVVGFALETTDVVAHAREKLERKQLDLIVVNDATEEGAGFGVDTNRVTLLSRAGADERLPLMPKRELADVILDRVVRLLNGR
jgi:phosphopantothenoylcysteine decarboxylase / phosphopantothenate---cysteine ligase